MNRGLFWMLTNAAATKTEGFVEQRGEASLWNQFFFCFVFQKWTPQISSLVCNTQHAVCRVKLPTTIKRVCFVTHCHLKNVAALHLITCQSVVTYCPLCVWGYIILASVVLYLLSRVQLQDDAENHNCSLAMRDDWKHIGEKCHMEAISCPGLWTALNRFWKYWKQTHLTWTHTQKLSCAGRITLLRNVYFGFFLL